MSQLLQVSGLGVAFRDKTVVEDLSFSIPLGKTLAIVGESGSGKSVTSAAIMGLLPYMGGRQTAGRILFQREGGEIDLSTAGEKTLRHIRGNEIAMIFQEPMTSLDPVFSIGYQIREVLALHRNLRGAEAEREVVSLLELVRLPHAKDLAKRYPHQLSGGMRQRVMIAMAAACHPRLLIADEPTTALDVTIQAQILHILRDMQQTLGMSILFISHDMGVVAEMADDIVVMRHGRKVEDGTAHDIILRPQAAYTRELMAAVPRIGAMQGKHAPEKFPDPNAPDTSVESANTPAVHDQPLIAVRELTTRYPVRSGLFNRMTHQVCAAEKVSFDIYPGETLALVGESGSGKSTVGKTLQQLISPSGGQIFFRGQDILHAPSRQKALFKRQIQYVFQDPYGSLNPRRTIRQSLTEPMALHGLLHDGKRQVAELLEAVRLPADVADRYPHEFSGGQRQRICIARALACEPSLIIADEAVSALDVSVQAQIINLLIDLQRDKGLAFLFISHDMAVVERVSHRVAVMYLGRIVEIGTRAQIFENPQHEYTRQLLAAVPVIEPGRRPPPPQLDREIPSTIHPAGHEFVPYHYQEIDPGHWVATSPTQGVSA